MTKNEIDKIKSSTGRPKKPKKPKKNKDLVVKSPGLGRPARQMELFKVEKQIEHDGIEMGVLENGIPYVTQAGLARMCGIDERVLNRLASNWKEERLKPRGIEIDKLLKKQDFNEETLFLKSKHKGRIVNAFTEPVCFAVLEYYAFITDDPRETAVDLFRYLARKTFRDFIYIAVGYNPIQNELQSWKYFRDRVSLTVDSSPLGFYIVFHEMWGILVPMINSGIIITDKVIPDISVGIIWSKYWKENKMETEHGERIKFEHNYPSYYAQAKSNPQLPFAYPDSSLPIFRSWFRENYITKNFPKYLIGQQKRGVLNEYNINRILKAVSPKKITEGEK